MGKALDLAGQKFNKLTVLHRTTKNAKGSYFWMCLCDCGSTVVALGAQIKNGNTKSCGCLKTDVLIKRNTTHGESKHPAYSNWKDMFKRCKPEYKRHESYFDRGITVHPLFGNFLKFLDEIGLKPDDGQRWSVGRIDNNKSYEPGNIRWELDVQQARNHTRQVNNKTGIVGIHLRTRVIAGRTYESFVSCYTTLDGNKVTKEFSINKYGHESAKALAAAFREEGMKLLQAQGADYAASHGSEK